MLLRFLCIVRKWNNEATRGKLDVLALKQSLYIVAVHHIRYHKSLGYWSLLATEMVGCVTLPSSLSDNQFCVQNIPQLHNQDNTSRLKLRIKRWTEYSDLWCSVSSLFICFQYSTFLTWFGLGPRTSLGIRLFENLFNWENSWSSYELYV